MDVSIGDSDGPNPGSAVTETGASIDYAKLEGIESKKSKKATPNRLYASSPPVFKSSKYYIFPTAADTYIIRSDMLATFENIARLPIGDLEAGFRSNINLIPDLLARQEKIREPLDTNSLEDILGLLLKDSQGDAGNSDVYDYYKNHMYYNGFYNVGMVDNLLNAATQSEDKKLQANMANVAGKGIREIQILIGTKKRIPGTGGYAQTFQNAGQRLRSIQQTAARGQEQLTGVDKAVGNVQTFLMIKQYGEPTKTTYMIEPYNDRVMSDLLNLYLFLLGRGSLNAINNISVPTKSGRNPGKSTGEDMRLLSLNGINDTVSSLSSKQLVSAAIAWNLADKSKEIIDNLYKMTEFIEQTPPNFQSITSVSDTENSDVDTYSVRAYVDSDHSQVDKYYRRIIAMLLSVFCPDSNAYRIFKKGKGGQFHFTELSEAAMRNTSRMFIESVVTLSPELEALKSNFEQACADILGSSLWTNSELSSYDPEGEGYLTVDYNQGDMPTAGGMEYEEDTFSITENDMRRLVLELLARKLKI